MPKTTTLQLYACAKALKQLLQQGNHGPTVEEVAREAHGELWPIGASEIEFVVQHASRIVSILGDDDELTVLLVNKKYFSQFRRRQPATAELAKTVLPGRGNSRPAGFHLVEAEDDTIWLAAQERLGGVGIGVVTKYKNEITRAVRQNRLSLNNGETALRAIKDKI